MHDHELGEYVHKRSDRLGWAFDLLDKHNLPLAGTWTYALTDNVEDGEALARSARQRAFVRGCRCIFDVTLFVDYEHQSVLVVVGHQDVCPLGEV